tara:strand:+ start:219 stop:428 length:210 start_codon:yes stop_codon:yes gene_type:complete
MTTTKNLLLTLAVGVAIGFGWYKLWVEPHDQYRAEIMECMGSEEIAARLPSNSRAAYDMCVAKLKEERQ